MIIIEEITTFLVITFTWTYFFWGSVALHNQKIIGKQPDAYLHLGGFGPLIAASICSFFYTDFYGFWTSMYSLHFINNGEMYITAFVTTFLITVFGFILANLPFHVLKAPQSEFKLQNIGIFIIVFIFCLIMIIGEEAGWRGFLLPRVVSLLDELGYSHPKALSSPIIGLIWSIWHLPIFYWGDYPLVVDGYKLKDIILYQISYTIGLSGISAIMVWIYYETGHSIIGMLIIHGCLNATAGLCGVKRLNNLFGYIGLASLPVICYLINKNII